MHPQSNVLKYTTHTTSGVTHILAVLTDRKLPVAKNGVPLQYYSLGVAREKVRELNKRLKQTK